MSGFLLRRARLVDAGIGRSSDAVDVRVRHGRVTEVGPDLAPSAGGDEELIELEGRWVVPGLWDAHTHMTQWALARQRLDVSAATSAAQAAALVAERLRDAPPAAGAPLVGFGFRDALWPDAPTAELLDAASGQAVAGQAVAGQAVARSAPPVVLVSGDLHCGWLSTAAAHRFGVPEAGLLREHAWFEVLDRLGEAPEELADAWVAEAAAAAATRGVVGVVDFERADAWDAWPRRVAAGQRGLRVVCSVWPESLDLVVGRGLRSGDALPVPGAARAPEEGAADRLLTMGPLKVISDGSLNTRTAYCHDPYPDIAGPGAHGELSVPESELVRLLGRATAAGLECAVHAIGDRAVSLALDAFEASGARGSIEHAQLLTGDDVARLASMGLTASVQPEHAMDDRDVADRLWAGRTDRAFPFAGLHRSGARLALGSDAPVAPLDPWLSIGAAVDRARDGRPAWHPEQRLTAAVALAASTRGRTVVQPGDVADVAVLDADPLSVHDDLLRKMPVAATAVAGRWTHRTI